VNVTCSQCGKKYALSDDRVAGKTSVKIRCKQCGNVTTVQVAAAAPARTESTPSPNPWDAERTKAMPSLDSSDTWFAMVGGKQVGPMGVPELKAKIADGTATLRTYLWKPTMADWKRAADIPELSPLFAAGATASRPALGASPPAGIQAAPAVRSSTSGLREAPKQPQAARPSEVVTARPQVSSLDGDDDSGLATVAARPVFGSSPSKIEAAAKSTPVVDPKPSASSSASAPLSDLFGDVSAESQIAADDVPTQVKAVPLGASATAPSDPFKALSEGDGVEAPKPHETTNFFIAKSGAKNRNPPWKIALFVLSLVGIPTAIVYLLSTLKIIPPVVVTNENGEEVQQSWFSPEGASGLADILTGKAKQKAAEAAARKAAAERERAEKERAEKEKHAGGPKPTGVSATEKSNVRNDGSGAVVGGDPFASVKVDQAQLKELYGDTTDKKGTVPKNRQETGTASGGPVVNSSGLTEEASNKVISEKMKGFVLCADNALKRNPNMAAGTVTLQLIVGTSGVVKSAMVSPKKYDGSELGQCLVSTAKRIVFPQADGESEIQVPLKVGATM
jgi:GYF domain 2/zinc-ribbon domain